MKTSGTKATKKTGRSRVTVVRRKAAALICLILPVLIFQAAITAAATPILTTPAVNNLGANQATLTLQSDQNGTGYFTLLSGSGASCGTGSQVSNGQDSTGAQAFRQGSLPLTANTPGSYTVRNLFQNSAYTLCFAADDGTNLQPIPVTTSLTTSTETANTTWVPVGSHGFPAVEALFTNLSFAPDGTPYVAYLDARNGYAVTVMKYSGGAWTYVGSPDFSARDADYTSLSFAPDGTPYIAYDDGGNGDKVTVMKYSGRAWTYVGSPGFSADWASDINLSFAPDGTPYVAYQDGNDHMATVMKYSGGAWTYVGSPGFSADLVDYLSLSFAPDGTPYVAYQDYGGAHRATVMKYSGGAWTSLGISGFFTDAAYLSPSLAPDGTPYVVYSDERNGWKATVMKYSNGAWTSVGSPDFSAGRVDQPRLSFAPDGNPYVAYQDYSNDWKATVMKYSGGAWIYVGSPGFSAEAIEDISLFFAPDGTPYVAFQDFDNYVTTVMRLGTSAPGTPSSKVTITPTMTGSGTIAPSNPVTVTVGKTQSFKLLPTYGYHIASVEGCVGSLNGAIYTTGLINADCTVTVDFEADPISYTWETVSTPATIPYKGSSKTIPVSVIATGPVTAATISASSSAGWITVANDGTSVKLNKGKGGGKVAINVAANNSSASRSGTVTVNGQEVTITQTGAPCTIGSVTATPASFTADGGTGSVQVVAPEGCGWSVTQPTTETWLTVPATSSTGTGSFTITAASNQGSTVNGKYKPAKTRKTVLTVVSATGSKKTVSIAQTGN